MGEWGRERILNSLELYLGKPASELLRHYQVQEGENDRKHTWEKVKTRNENIKINK
jgi:hypothetical protein